MYSYWNRVELNPIHLNDLSNLFIGIEYDSKNYDMHHYDKTKHTKEDIVKLVGSIKMNELYKYYPKTKDKVTYYSIGTPLTNQHYFGVINGEGYGLKSTSERYSSFDLKPEHIPASLNKLSSEIPP